MEMSFVAILFKIISACKIMSTIMLLVDKTDFVNSVSVIAIT
jgi:hypothetical protein